MDIAMFSSSALLLLTLCCYGEIFADSSDNFKCTFIDSPGYTLPEGTIYVEEGSKLDIYCVLNHNHSSLFNRTVNDLFFSYNSTKRVPSQYITVLNDTTIHLGMENVSRKKLHFSCKLQGDVIKNVKETTVCSNDVIIDTKPKNITDFKCEFRNWVNVTCSWTNPSNYDSHTTYELRIQQSTSEDKKTNKYIGCPEKYKTANSCFLSLTTDPMYRRQARAFLFKIQGNNTFGTGYKVPFKILHYKNIIFDPPKSLEIVNITSQSAFICWEWLPNPAGLMHKVEYKSKWDAYNAWAVVNISSKSSQMGHKCTQIENLQYANTEYEVKVYIKSAVALNESFWSLPSNSKFKTMPSPPQHTPKTETGSFQIIENFKEKRDVYIYWQKIKESDYNGENLHYFITLAEGTKIQSSEQTHTYAKIECLNDVEYRFKIYSVNNEGRSSGSSEVFIPSRNRILSKPRSFTKTVYANNTYELSWKPPSSVDYFSKTYTLFWCDSIRDRPYQCDGYLNWTHISGDAVSYNITMPDDKLYQFAISVNSATSSSGMVWSTCTVTKNHYSGKMSNVEIKHVTSSSIQIQWELECSDRVGGVRGFVIFFCPVTSNITPMECDEPEQSVTLNSTSVEQYNVTKLQSYKMYKLRVAVLTSNGHGEPSDPVSSRTHDAAPSKPPHIVSVQGITNTSATFIWKKPEEKYRNGEIIYYEYCRVGGDLICKEARERPGMTQNVSVYDLEPYTEYNFTIRACTSDCSNFSEDKVFHTDVGMPSKMAQPYSEYINETIVKIKWKPVIKPAGPIDGYEIKIKYHGDEKDQVLSQSCSEVKCNDFAIVTLNRPFDCANKSRPIVQIRAFNIKHFDGKELKLYGDWSNPHDLNCYYYNRIVIYIVSIVITLPVSFLLYYYAGILFNLIKPEINTMKDLAVHLPPGLNPKESPEKSISTTNCMKPALPPDREHLIRSKFIRTPNMSESENDSESLRMGSDDTQMSEYHSSPNSSGGSEISTASTLPMHYRIQNPTSKIVVAELIDKMDDTEFTQNSIESEINPNLKLNNVNAMKQDENKKYVIIGPGDIILHPSELVLDYDSHEDDPLSLDLKTFSSYSKLPNFADQPPADSNYCIISNIEKSEISPSFSRSQPPPLNAESKKYIEATVNTTNMQPSVRVVQPSTSSGSGYDGVIKNQLPSVTSQVMLSSSSQSEENTANTTPPVASSFVLLNRSNNGYVTVSSVPDEPRNADSV